MTYRSGDLIEILRVLRPLVAADFAAWSEVRTRNEGWLLKWEQARLPMEYAHP